MQGLFISLLLRMSSLPQKQPETHGRRQDKLFLFAHVCGQAEPHRLYSPLIARQQTSGLTHLPFFSRTKPFLQKHPRRHIVGHTLNFRTRLRSSSHVRGHADPHSVYSAFGSWHNELLHSNSGIHRLFD